MKKILLLDIENLHKTENELLTYLKQYSSIYLVYAKSPISFSLDGLVKLSPFIMNGKLKVLKMPKIGKDAADFGLTFIAGQLSTQVSAKEFSFDVMSNDHSMGYVVDLLKIAKFEAKIIHEKPLVSVHVINEVKAEQNVGELIFQYCEYLTKNAARPAKLESLLNSLKAILKVSDDVAKVLVELLKKHKIIRLDNSKIFYQDPSLQKFLKSNKQT
ncbi:MULTISPECIES: PIN domain-containing protein, partial [unclassified Acinetobacter]